MGKFTYTNHQDVPPQTEEKKKAKVLDYQIVNVRELRKAKKQKNIPQQEKGEYSSLGYWLLFGSVIGAIFALLGFVNFRFLYLVPMGPISAFVAWVVKRTVGKDKLENNLK